MIITRTPFRLPLGGGGTDLPSYYKMFGGHLLTAAINKYMYVSINEPATSDNIKIYYAFTEKVKDVSEINHNIIRESLKYFNINQPIEIGSMADIEAGTGMGSSSAFTVGLMDGLNTMKRSFVSPIQLAEQACYIEIDKAGKPIGVQDQYATALGGINELIIDTDGIVHVIPLNLSEDIIFELESRLMMFYTNSQRDANDILKDQTRKIDELDIIEAMHEIKDIGESIKKAIVNCDMDSFGVLLHQHWIVKKTISSKMSNDKIDEYYKLALKNGALGGKIMGAGGGGFMLLCAMSHTRRHLKETMIEAGLKYMDFRFEFEGAKVITNI